MRDESGFDEFYLATRVRLVRQLTLMTADLSEAEDALQEAYERAWRRWSRVSGLRDPEAWVRTVAWRVAVSRFRRAVVAARMLPKLLQPTEGPADQVDHVLDLQEALGRVQPEYRRAVVLHDLCDYTLAAVAEETGAPVGTVKSRVSRGRAALADVLGSQYQDSGLPGNTGDSGVDHA
jgi:RNA polymerase sigma-70 factor (ECF subfamily)